MKKQIIIINGTGGVGKDMFIELCNIYAKSINVSTVDKVKEAAEILGWDGKSKTENDRLFLSDLKLLAGAYNDHAYKYAKEQIEFFIKSDNWSRLLFIHVREPEEIKRFKTNFDCLTLLIRNKNVKSISSNMADANVEKFHYDFVIDNSGTLTDLRESAAQFVMKILDSNVVYNMGVKI